MRGTGYHMKVAGAARERARAIQDWGTDAKWAIPLAANRLTRGRLASSPELYRGTIAWLRGAQDPLPGMTTLSERAYFTWHARDCYRGEGAIVDLGSWFGSTTATLAMGLSQNRRAATRNALIDAYDLFTWQPWMDDYASLARLGPYAVGESFQREFDHVVEPWRERIRVHAGDLTKQEWGGGPIELLLIDAMKSWELAWHILNKFIVAIAERGYLIHQDFSNCFTPWIHLMMYRLREHAIPVNDVTRSETVVFRIDRLPAGDPELLDLNRASFDSGEVARAFDHSLRITRTDKHSGIRAARVMLLIYDGELAAARDELRRLQSAGRLIEWHAVTLDAAIGRAATVDSAQEA
jgi:hypothetical protein